MSESTTEESGPPVTTEPGPVRPPIIITPPPLSVEQVEKLEALGEAFCEAAEAIGTLYGQYCRWVWHNFKPMLIPPLVPPALVPETPPSTTP
jgi:hypothetical protein